MTLTLTNFRNFAGTHVFHNLPIDFDDTSASTFTLLNGPSGSGKSTMLMAIDFVLTGNGRKVTTFGRRSCSVTLEFRSTGATICRTKGPCSLTYTTDGSMYEGKDAESRIQKYCRLWTSAYVPQKFYRSFLFMSPHDRLEYVETLAFDRERTDRLMQRCRELTKHRKSTVDSYQYEVNRLSSSSIAVDDDDSTTPFTSAEDADRSIRQSYAAMVNAKSRYDGQRSLYDLRDRLLGENDDDDDDGAGGDLTVFGDYESKWLEAHDRWTRYTRELQKLDKLTERIMSLETTTSPPQIVDDDRVEYKRFLSFNTTIDDGCNLRASLDDCPSCGTRISYDFVDRRIYASSTPHQPSFSDCCTKLESVALKRKYSRIVDHDEELKRQSDAELLSTLKSNLIQLSTVVDRLRCVEPTQLRNIVEKRKRQAVVGERRRRIATLPSSIDVEYTEWTTAKAEYDDVVRRKAKYDLLVEKALLSTARQNLTDAKAQHERIVLIQSIIEKAISLSVHRIVDQIDAVASSYIDMFLPSHQLFMVLADRKLDVSCLLNGMDADVASLSGGELARALVAYAMAMTAVTNDAAPDVLVVLDEILSPLDEETADLVMQSIRSRFKGNMICVSHQATKGIFDNVIEL